MRVWWPRRCPPGSRRAMLARRAATPIWSRRRGGSKSMDGKPMPGTALQSMTLTPSKYARSRKARSCSSIPCKDRPTGERSSQMSDAQENDPVQRVIVPPVRDLGDGFTVRRALPSVGQRMVAPFVFFDRMGPVTLAPGRGLDVRPHPHIGLATVTYVLEGEILHRDSLGSVQPIQPGAVNWMTAGRGIVHSERPGPQARASGGTLPALQIWVALPEAHEEAEPAFVHHAAGTIPAFEGGGVEGRLVVGASEGLRSPRSSRFRRCCAWTSTSRPAHAPAWPASRPSAPFTSCRATSEAPGGRN